MWSHSLILAPNAHILSEGHCRETVALAVLNISEHVQHSAVPGMLLYDPFFPCICRSKWLWMEFSPLKEVMQVYK